MKEYIPEYVKVSLFQISKFTTKRGKVGPKLLGMKIQRKDMMSLISLSCLFLAQFLG